MKSVALWSSCIAVVSSVSSRLWSTPLTRKAATAVLSAVVLTAKANATDTSSGCAPTLLRKSMNFWLSDPDASSSLPFIDDLMVCLPPIWSGSSASSSASLFGRSNDGSAEDDSVADALATSLCVAVLAEAEADALALDELPDEQAARARARAAMRPRAASRVVMKSSLSVGDAGMGLGRRLWRKDTQSGRPDQRRWMERWRLRKRPSPAAPFQSAPSTMTLPRLRTTSAPPVTSQPS